MLEDDYAGPESMDDVLAQCEGVKYITCLDLTMSFWQIEVAKDSRKYGYFKIFGRVFQFKRVAFGTKQSGGALARALDHVFGYPKYLSQFIDENLCISDNFENHLNHVEIIFRK